MKVGAFISPLNFLKISSASFSLEAEEELCSTPTS